MFINYDKAEDAIAYENRFIAKEFYFLGEIYAQGEPHPIHMVKSNDDAFEIMYQLDVPVRNDIYDYIVR